MHKILLTSALCAFATFATAQVSLDDADAAMNQADAGMTAFQERLNDPDPDRALAVLKLLITKGDADQRRLAIRHGLGSTDSAIRTETVRAIFDSSPNLRAVFLPVAEANVYYTREINGAGGVLDENSNGSVTWKLVGYDEAEECWVHKSGAYTPCLVRMRGEDVSIWFGNSWGTYRLNDSGQLMGQQYIQQNLANGLIDLYE